MFYLHYWFIVFMIFIDFCLTHMAAYATPHSASPPLPSSCLAVKVPASYHHCSVCSISSDSLVAKISEERSFFYVDIAQLSCHLFGRCFMVYESTNLYVSLSSLTGRPRSSYHVNIFYQTKVYPKISKHAVSNTDVLSASFSILMSMDFKHRNRSRLEKQGWSSRIGEFPNRITAKPCLNH